MRSILPILLIASFLLLTGCEYTITQAVRNNKYDKVKQMLDEDPALVNYVDPSKERGGAKDPNANAGWTPLHYAANRKNNRIAELLIERGADTYAKDPAGWDPLDAAMKSGALKIEKMIRDARKKAPQK